MPGANWRTELNKKEMPLYTNVFSGWLDYPEYFFYWCYHGNNSVFNTMSYKSPEMDKLIDGARTAAATGDKATYDTDVKGFVDLAFTDIPRIPLYQPFVNVAMQKNISGYQYWFHRRLDYRALVEGVRARDAMLTMIGKRLMFAIPSLIGVVIVTFLLTRALPGDPAAYFAGPAATKEAVEQIRKKLGFDKPLIEQFFRYTNDLAHGDFGNSLTTGQPVATEIRNRLPASAELTLLGLVVSIVIAIPLGVLAATRPGSWIDHLCRVTTTAGVSLPVFFTGLVLVYVFYFRLGWSPAPLGRLDVFYSAPPTVTGFYLIDTLIARDFEAFRSALSQLILPATTLAIFSLAPIARMTRASMLAVLASDFVRTARASGLSPAHRDRHLRVPQRDAAGHHHAQHGVLVPARRQRAGGKGVRLARHRLLRGGSADLVGLRAGAGFRADHGGHVRAAQSGDRHSLWRDRSASAAGRVR